MNKEKLVALFGKDNVSFSPEVLKKYEKNAHLGAGIAPVAAIMAKSSDDVLKAVQWANETKTPLVPVSSTGKHYRGGSNPSVPGAVMLDMSGMKKIRSINRTFRMAVAEPGVTYGELAEALEKEGMYVNTSLAPRSDKSVLADLLEVNPRVDPTTQWSFKEPMRCVEVVWGDGQRMGTGEAYGPPLEVHQANEKWQINPDGPAHIDYNRLLSQAEGTMGVVTWASIHCNTLPSIHRMFLVPAAKLSDLESFLYRVTDLRFGSELLVLNAADLANLIAESKEEVRALQTRLPAWTALVGVSAADLLPEKKYEQQYLDLLDIAQECGLEMVPSYNGISGDAILPRVIKPCPADKYWKETRKGAFMDILFVQTIENAPKYVDIMMQAAAEYGIDPGDVGVYLQPQHQGVSAQIEFTIAFDPENIVESRNARALFDEASARLSRNGAFFAKPYGKWARLQYNKDAQTTIMVRRLKDIFNPNNILNPGKLTDY